MLLTLHITPQNVQLLLMLYYVVPVQYRPMLLRVAGGFMLLRMFLF